MKADPISKGLAIVRSTGERVRMFFLPHDADAGESPAEDCYITLPAKLDGTGLTGLFPTAMFHQQFKYVE